MKTLLMPLALCAIAGFSHAQTLTDEELAQQILEELSTMNEEAEAQNIVGELTPRNFAQLRFLDRLNAKTEIIEVPVGQSRQDQHLNITVRSCFVPTTATTSDAIAFLEIRDDRAEDDDFDGYMIASSPALNALEHPRYDVWVVSCTQTASYGAPDGPPERPDVLNTDVIAVEPVAEPSPEAEENSDGLGEG